MNQPDRLAEIQAQLAKLETERNNLTRTGILIDLGRDAVPWLVGEVERLQGLLREELISVWTDLEQAIRRAHNGQWSMECDWFLDRIKTLTQQVGPARWEELPITLLENGLYQRTHAELGIDAPVDMDRVAEVRAVINKSVT